jgi:hypothetical protein
MGVLGQRSVAPGTLKCGRWDTVTGVGVRPWFVSSKSTCSGKPGQSGVPQSSRCSAGREDRVRPWSAPSKSAVVSGNSDQCSHIGARTASWIVPCGAASERFSRGCALTGIECPDGAPVALTRCHEFVDTTVTETRGDDVLDLRATRGSRGSVQSYSLLGMETPMVPY